MTTLTMIIGFISRTKTFMNSEENGRSYSLNRYSRIVLENVFSCINKETEISSRTTFITLSDSFESCSICKKTPFSCRRPQI